MQTMKKRVRRICSLSVMQGRNMGLMRSQVSVVAPTRKNELMVDMMTARMEQIQRPVRKGGMALMAMVRKALLP